MNCESSVRFKSSPGQHQSPNYLRTSLRSISGVWRACYDKGIFSSITVTRTNKAAENIKMKVVM